MLIFLITEGISVFLVIFWVHVVIHTVIGEGKVVCKTQRLFLSKLFKLAQNCFSQTVGRPSCIQSTERLAHFKCVYGLRSIRVNH